MSVISLPNVLDAQPAPGWSEDTLALAVGLGVVVVALSGLAGIDLLGWLVTTGVWIDPALALAPVSKSYAALTGPGALLATLVSLAAALSVTQWALGRRVGPFLAAFVGVFAISYAAWFLGNDANLAAVTPDDLKKFGIDWSLKLTSEGGFILALLAGVAIGNLLPGVAERLKPAILPELYIKIAIVILGAFLAITVAGRLSFASQILLRGVAAIIEAYLIYWSVVYYLARRYFQFPREWAVPLASGISICGVAAAISTGAAIRARPQIPVFVSSLVVLFAVVELLILPWLAQTFLADQPLVAAAWMGLAIKTDGAAIAGGSITEALLQAQAASQGVHYQDGWIVGTTAAIKVFIDMFIGVWAFILASIWTRHVNPLPEGQQARISEIWQRFPKFLIGFLLTFALTLALALSGDQRLTGLLKSAIAEANTLRVIFFLLTFFSIGLLSNVRALWADGIGKLAAVYVVSLFGFVIWVGLLISWLFFADIKPPLAG